MRPARFLIAAAAAASRRPTPVRAPPTRLLLRTISSSTPRATRASMTTFKYPSVRRDEAAADVLHGQRITDPYRWLEDPDAPETAAFVDAQNEVTQAYLAQSTMREKFKQRMTVMYDYEKFTCPFKRGSWYFYFHNSGLQPQSVMYKQRSLEAPGEELLNPNTLTTDGTKSLSTYGLTEDGTLMAYALSQSGSDWVTILVKDVDTGKDHADQIDWVKFSGIGWTHDNKGFFYSRYPKPASISIDKAGTETEKTENQKLYYHKLGSMQDDDVLIHADPNHPQWIFGGEVSDDGEYLIMTISESTDPVNRLYIAKLDKQAGVTGPVSFVKVVDNFEAQYDYITNDGAIFYFKTNKNAPKYKIVSLDFSDPTKGELVFKDVLPESDDPLQYARVVNEDKLITAYLHDVKDVLQVRELKTGKLIKDLNIEIGTVAGLSGRKEDTEFFYQHVSFLSPGLIFRVNASTLESVIFKETKVHEFDRNEFKVEQAFYSSKDGTKVPMFILSRKDMVKNGNNPLLLYGYGGFNISITPAFSVSRLVFARNMGGIVAVANIRGGGEYGEEWHKSGSLQRKQNGFDDFIAAAEYLVREQYTTPTKIAINGGSNGGLLVCASATQRPDLFGAVIADVGVLDMLRFHKFSIGFFWKADYGDPDVKEDFEYLLTYSPLHNVRAEKAPFPAMLLTTGDHDDRVVPLHSFKMIAQLQHTLGHLPEQKQPLLIRIEKKAGHGAGRPTQKIIDETTDRFTFLGLATGVTWAD